MENLSYQGLVDGKNALVSALLLQATKDYLKSRSTEKKTKKKRSEILEDLRTKTMSDLTDGRSDDIARKLENADIEQLKANLKKSMRGKQA